MMFKKILLAASLFFVYNVTTIASEKSLTKESLEAQLKHIGMTRNGIVTVAGTQYRITYLNVSGDNGSFTISFNTKPLN